MFAPIERYLNGKLHVEPGNNPFLKGNFAPVDHEHSYEMIDIIAGEVRDEGGDLLATSASEFAMFDKAQFTKLGLVPEDELDSMTITFAESHDYGHSYEKISGND